MIKCRRVSFAAEAIEWRPDPTGRFEWPPYWPTTGVNPWYWEVSIIDLSIMLPNGVWCKVGDYIIKDRNGIYTTMDRRQFVREYKKTECKDFYPCGISRSTKVGCSDNCHTDRCEVVI